MSVSSEQVQRHPLNQIYYWIDSHPEGEVNVINLFTQGPSILDISDVEFREWVNTGLHLKMIAIGGLANIIKVVRDAEIENPLPEKPTKHLGY
jgi:hypothetical protein